MVDRKVCSSEQEENIKEKDPHTPGSTEKVVEEDSKGKLKDEGDTDPIVPNGKDIQQGYIKRPANKTSFFRTKHITGKIEKSLIKEKLKGILAEEEVK